MIVNIENEKLCFNDEKNNQKVLTNGGVCLFFNNVFDQNFKGKVPVIKPKLRKILIDFGLVQTCIEIDQKLNFIKIWYVDEQAMSLKGLLLQKFNRSKDSEAIELSISIEGNLVAPPSKEIGIRAYTGLTKLVYQEFISEIKSSSMIDDDPYNQMKEIIKQGNLAASEPLQAILAEGVD